MRLACACCRQIGRLTFCLNQVGIGDIDFRTVSVAYEQRHGDTDPGERLGILFPDPETDGRVRAFFTDTQLD